MLIELDIIPPKNTGQSGKRLGCPRGRAMMFETKESKDTKAMYLALLYEKNLPIPSMSPFQ